MAETRQPAYRLQWLEEISAVPKKAWNALAQPLHTPVLEWEWLRRMEVSGSMRPETGWLPLHLTVWAGPQLAAAAPLYLKGHSEGEFVWDYIWADVAGRSAIPYYPKMVGMSPATPVSGYRFLIAPGEDEELLTRLIVEAIDNLCRRNNVAGLAFNYVDPAWLHTMQRNGFIAWKHQSYLWQNPGFGSFEEYLWSFDKNQRRNIRRERKKLAEQGLRLRTYTGAEISLAHLRRMYHFYELTNAQFGPWAAKYLSEEFFTGLHEDFRHRIVLIAALKERDKQTQEPEAMSFCLSKNSRLYGRYWGTENHYDSLHFNACYYAPIEWAIERGVHSFDPGIGSAHKVRRGFKAVANWSLHHFYDERLNRIMAQNIDRINAMEQERIDALNSSLPFAADRPPLSS